jgi:hypothetical protein
MQYPRFISGDSEIQEDPLKKFLEGQRFVFDDDAKTAIRQWFCAQLAKFYNSGISKLVV